MQDHLRDADHFKLMQKTLQEIQLSTQTEYELDEVLLDKLGIPNTEAYF